MTGKELYELHVESVLALAPYHTKYLYQWHQIGLSTQAAWERTAAKLTPPAAGQDVPRAAAVRVIARLLALHENQSSDDAKAEAERLLDRAHGVAIPSGNRDGK